MRQSAKMSLAERILEYLFEVSPSEENPTTESALAKRFHVSRTPVREALTDLVRDGYIVRRKGKGLYLRPLTIAEIVAVYDLRAVLEGFAARMAAERAVDSDLDDLMDLANRFTQHRRRGEMGKAEKTDLAFHKKIIDLAGNPFLLNIMVGLRILERAFKVMHPQRPRKNRNVSSFPHERVVESFRKGDPGDCEKSVRMHIQHSKRYIVEDAFGFKMNPYGDGSAH